MIVRVWRWLGRRRSGGGLVGIVERVSLLSHCVHTPLLLLVPEHVQHKVSEPTVRGYVDKGVYDDMH